MSLDPTKLERLRDLPDGGRMARCPACAETGQDRRGDHLRIYPDGKFGCCVFPGDHDHRKRIFALAGDDRPRVIRVKVAPPTKQADSSPLTQPDLFGRLGRVFSTPTLQTSPPTAADALPTPADQAIGVSPLSRTLRTPFQNSRVCTVQEPQKEVYTHKEFWPPVRSVREGGTGTKHPHLAPDGTLVIPFDSPERFHWWNGGQSVAATRAEVLAHLAAEEKECHESPRH